MKRKTVVVISCLVLGAALIAFFALQHGPREGVSAEDKASPAAVTNPHHHIPARASRASVPAEPSAATVESSQAATQADEEERLVETFDDLTDRWMEPSEKGVTMDDVSAFVATFSHVPPERKEECLQRALNLIPDENVMLLAGVLMDKSLPKECAERVFNDVLNRRDEVKKPILRQVFKDKSHPCYTDAAWILDVTGEKPD